MQIKTVLAVDFGINQWGLAVGNTATRTALPIKAVKVKKGIPNWDELQAVQAQWRASQIIIGLPLNMDGTDQPLTKKVRKMAKMLEEHLGLPVDFQDERLSTVEAKAKLFEESGYKSLQKDRIDCLSAVIILEDWLSLIE